MAWWAGEPHSDRPQCLSRVIGDFLWQWNDSMSDDDRQLLVPFIPRLVGTAASAAVEERRGWMIFDWGWRVALPTWLRRAALSRAAAVAEGCPQVVDVPSEDRVRDAVRQVIGEPPRLGVVDLADGRWEVPFFSVSAAGGSVLGGPYPWCTAAAHAALQEVGGDTDPITQTALLRPTVVQVQATALTLLDRMIDAGQSRHLEWG